MRKELLIVFVKNTELGKVKTRLAATIGAERALIIYHSLLKKTWHELSGLHQDIRIYYSDYIEENDIWDSKLFHKKLQDKGDLGNKMHTSLKEGFKDGYDAIVLIGSDCYDLNAKIIRDAFQKLLTHDVAVGPAKDGGYYLLGMNKLIDTLFIDKSWSTAHLLTETLKDLDRLTLSYFKLPLLRDIDDEEDLKQTPELLKDL